MRDIKKLLGYSFVYAKSYFLESLAVRWGYPIPKPLYVGLSVGTVCNFRCRHCDLWKMKTEPQNYLRVEEIKKILKALKKWLGPFRLTLTGAEPLLNSGIFEVLSFASQLEIYTIITTNAWLVNRTSAKRLVKSGVDVVNISLDGYLPRTHDYLRGKKGAYKRVVKGVGELKEARGRSRKPLFYFNTVIMRQNLAELPKLVKMTKRLSLDAIRFQALESKWLFGNQDLNINWYKTDKLWPREKKKIRSVFSELIKLKRSWFPIKNTISELNDLREYYLNPASVAQKHRFCFTGVRNFAIDEYGKVKLCFGMSTVGDLRKQKPEEIWFGKSAESLRKVIKNCSCYCRILPCNKREGLGQLMGVFFNKIRTR